MAHPVLVLKKGKMSISRFYFGSKEQAWKKYMTSAFRVTGVINRRILFITYVGMSSKELEHVREMVKAKINFEEVYIQKASPAIAANCGPGTFGLLFFTEY